ncbi:MAG: hypothetical protein KOO63_08310 [Bacteroidales bacterium]|nr:hypothetical protein [Candidatus Latescibacterota bacterium]
MRKGIITDIDWAFIGAELACCDADEQASFFKSFIKEMKSWDTNHRGETQLCYVNMRLDDPEKEFLKMLSHTQD